MNKGQFEVLATSDDNNQVTWDDGDESVHVSVWRGLDGALVIEIDTEEEGRVRVNLNDGTVFDQDTGTGSAFPLYD